MYTNADINANPAERQAFEDADHNKGIIQDAVRNAMIAGAEFRDVEVTTDASTIIALESDLKADVTGDTKYLKPLAMTMDPSWPHPTRMRPELTKNQWRGIMEGVFCFSCRWRLPTAHWFECPSCKWTQDNTSQAINYLYERRFITYTPTRG